jgi:hypothetical protein
MAFDIDWALPLLPTPLPEAINIVDPILDLWCFFVLLVLLFVIGVRKQKGIWSTSQPWIGGPVPYGAQQKENQYPTTQMPYQGQPIPYQQYTSPEVQQYTSPEIQQYPQQYQVGTAQYAPNPTSIPVTQEVHTGQQQPLR